MSFTIDFDPRTEAKINELAQQEGVEPTAYIQKLISVTLPSVHGHRDASAKPQTASKALLRSWLAQIPTDPEEIKIADAELLEFQRGMNANRAATGERIPYPDVE